MKEHELSLEFPDTLKEHVLMIIDTSLYNEFIDVDENRLWIAPPGFNHSIELDPGMLGFRLNLTACDLCLQGEGCGEHNNTLPDGLYRIKYSICPHDEVYVDYFHLRVTKLMNRYYNLLCDLDISGCEPSEDLRDDLNRLREIRSYIEAAKAKVEVCHDIDKGMELFDYAKKLMDKFECKNC